MRVFKLFFTALLFVISWPLLAGTDLIELFPLGRYSQKVETWIKPGDPHYQEPVISADLQRKKADQFYEHFMGSLSPWSMEYVNQTLSRASPNDIKSLQQAQIAQFSNRNKLVNKLGYGFNFHLHPLSWISQITHNMNLAQFGQVTYQPRNRGIAIDNLHARLLPTEDVHFYSHKLAGEGYPFDNLQMSSIWVGTPVYVLGETRDHHWLLVLTPDFLVWVKASGIARVRDTFVNQWQTQAKKKRVAVTRTQIPLRDKEGRYLYAGYVGAVFPAEENAVWLPARDLNGNAVISHSSINPESMAVIPLPATPKNFSKVMRTLIGRPYGWGNLYFYNDCSSELKNLFTPFGVWLPRQSLDQSKMEKVIDLSSLSKEQRLAYLLEKGRPFTTVAYVGAHVLLYVGKHPSLDATKEGGWMAMTYQNMWGLGPNPAVKRSVIGRSVFLPLLLEYPEDKHLVSQIDKPIFKLIFLDSEEHYVP